VADDKQLKRTPIRFEDSDLERETENIYRQMNNITNTEKNRTFEFYVAKTKGAAANSKLTVELNKYGIVTKLELET